MGRLALVLVVALAAAPASAEPAPSAENPVAPAPTAPVPPASQPQPAPAAPGAPEVPAAPPSEPPSTELAGAVDGLLRAGQVGAAVAACQQVEAEASGRGELLDASERAACARAQVALGDRLHDVRDLSGALDAWKEAARLDPRLYDDPAYLDRLRRVRRRPDRPLVTPPPTLRPPPPPPPPPPEPPRPTRPPGPRADRGLGLGLSAGFDGILAITAAWMTREIVSVEVSVGLLFPTLDARVRLYGMRKPLTPVFGLGMTTPLGRTARFGLDATSYRDLYVLGETVHFDLGLSYTPTPHLDLFAGAALVTTLDTRHPDRVIFFPQAAFQALWYF